ncbi:MAG: DUF2530 domain-containing protein [Marmoricola sp.]
MDPDRARDDGHGGPGSPQLEDPGPGLVPLDVDGIRTVQVGTALWGVAFLVLLAFVDRLRADGHLWWLWACAAGFGLGLAGWADCRRRRRTARGDTDIR